MFDLVADVEEYPQFLPLCEAWSCARGNSEGGQAKSSSRHDRRLQVHPRIVHHAGDARPASNCHHRAEYIEGPFRYLENIWRFEPRGRGESVVRFTIDYEFRSRTWRADGAVFDRAFRTFAEAFEKRADAVYGRQPGRSVSERRPRPRQRGLSSMVSARVTSPRRMPERPRSGKTWRSWRTAAAASQRGEMDEADRLVRRAAARSGDAGDRDREIGRRVGERTLRHCPRDALADGAARARSARPARRAAPSSPRSSR